MSLLEKLRTQRERSVEVEPGITLRFRRPIDGHMQVVRNMTPDTACSLLVGWEGITEAYLLGGAVGSSDAVEFDPELAIEIVGDRGPWLIKLASAIAESVRQFYGLKDDVEKN